MGRLGNVLSYRFRKSVKRLFRGKSNLPEANKAKATEKYKSTAMNKLKCINGKESTSEGYTEDVHNSLNLTDAVAALSYSDNIDLQENEIIDAIEDLRSDDRITPIITEVDLPEIIEIVKSKPACVTESTGAGDAKSAKYKRSTSHESVWNQHLQAKNAVKLCQRYESSNLQKSYISNPNDLNLQEKQANDHEKKLSIKYKNRKNTGERKHSSRSVPQMQSHINEDFQIENLIKNTANTYQFPNSSEKFEKLLRTKQNIQFHPGFRANSATRIQSASARTRISKSERPQLVTKSPTDCLKELENEIFLLASQNKNEGAQVLGNFRCRQIKKKKEHMHHDNLSSIKGGLVNKLYSKPYLSHGKSNAENTKRTVDTNQSIKKSFIERTKRVVYPVISNHTKKDQNNIRRKCAHDQSLDATLSLNGSPKLVINDKICIESRNEKKKLKTQHSGSQIIGDNHWVHADVPVSQQTQNSSKEEFKNASIQQGDLNLEDVSGLRNCKGLSEFATLIGKNEGVCKSDVAANFEIDKTSFTYKNVSGNLCPTGKHEIGSKDKICVCMQVKKLVLMKAKPVINEWHSGVHEQLPTDSNVVYPTCPKVDNPELHLFQLMKPTRISSGGQGTVAWVQNPITTLQYALKFKIRDDRNETNWRIERREAKILKKLNHPFIVQTYHIFETEEALFMAFEYLSGGCLWNHIARVGTLPECYVTYYAACILNALQYLHDQSIVYRDMKAENVVLDSKNRPKLIDFGMAKYLSLIKNQISMGSPSESQIGRTGFPSFMEDKNCQLNDREETNGINDSLENEDPPTRYYFAAYLAPEIYNQPAAANQFIDSWGLGYIVVEMVLGYGIFIPMPWEDTPGQHLTPTWTLQLPNDSIDKMSSNCQDFVFKMLLRQPCARMSLTGAREHAFFARVPWKSLASLTGPNLLKFRKSDESAKRAQCGVIHDPCNHKADPAFTHKFTNNLGMKSIYKRRKQCVPTQYISRKLNATSQTKLNDVSVEVKQMPTFKKENFKRSKISNK